MKTINSKGFKVSLADQKALDHYLLVSANKWAREALTGMINKSVKMIMKDYFEIYKAKQTESISADYAVVIPAVIAMEEFKPYLSKTPNDFDGENPPPDMTISRKESVSDEIWEGGFDIEDYEEAALKAYYTDPEAMLEWFMNNKIYQRRKAFVKEHEGGFFERKEAIPAHQDDFINTVCAKVGYKNRVQSEEESLL